MHPLSIVSLLFISLCVVYAEIPSPSVVLQTRDDFPNCLVDQTCSPHDPIHDCQTIVHYNGCISKICTDCYEDRVRVALFTNDTVREAKIYWINHGHEEECLVHRRQRVKAISMILDMDTGFVGGNTCGFQQTFDPKGWSNVLYIQEYLAGFDRDTPSLEYISLTNVTVRCCAQSNINGACMPIVPEEEEVKHCVVQTFALVPAATPTANQFNFQVTMTQPNILDDDRVSWYVSELTASCDTKPDERITIIGNNGEYTNAANALSVAVNRPATADNKGPIAFSMSAFHCCGDAGSVKFNAKVEFCQREGALQADGCVKKLCSDVPSFGNRVAQGPKMLPESFVMGGSGEFEAGSVILENQL